MGGGPEEDEVCMIAAISEDTKALVTTLKREFPDVTFITYDGSRPRNPKEFAAAISLDVWKKVTYLVTVRIFPPSLDAVPNLKWVHLTSAGVNQIQSNPIYTDTNDIIITNSSGIHGPQITEWIIMNMLVSRKKYDKLYELQKQHQWGSHNDIGNQKDHLNNRIGILGYGSIGRQVARVSSAMGMEVLAYTASPRTTPESRKDNGFIIPNTGDPDGTFPIGWFSGTDKASLHTFLSQRLDYLIVALPLTSSTKGMLSTAEFEILAKSNTYVINIGRGPIIDTSALITALNSESIAGAALDVTDPEPLPSDHPLWDAKNVIISPHISAMNTSYTQRSLQVFTGNLTRYKTKGVKAMWNVVDRKKGY